MAAMLPMCALFMLIMVQIFGVCVAAVKNIEAAEAQIAKAAQDWMSPASEHEAAWPCLEDIPLGSDGAVRIEGASTTVGFGAWRTEVDSAQEVAFVTKPVCSD